MTLKKLQIYNDVVRKDFNKYIDTKDFLSGFAEGGKGVFKGIKNTAKELAGQGSDAQSKYNELKEENEQISSGAKGIYEYTDPAGKMSGMVAAMIGTGGVLKGIGMGEKLANGTNVASTFWGDEKNKFRLKYPGDKLSQNIGATLMTAAYLAAPNAVPANKISKVLTGIRPEIESITKQLANGTINKSAAKTKAQYALEQALNFGKSTGTQVAKGSVEMTAITAFGQGLDKALGITDEKMQQYHPEGELEDVAKSMIIGNLIPSAVFGAAGIKSRQYAKESLYDIAENPQRFKSVFNDQMLSDPSLHDKAEVFNQDVDHLARTKAELDAHTDLTTEQKKQYILQDYNEKILRQKAEGITNEFLKSKIDDQIKKAAAIKESIFKGKTSDVLPQEDHLTSKEYKEVSEIKDDKELFDYFMNKGAKGYKTTLEAAAKMEDEKAGIREGLKYMQDKAVENPLKFREDFGNELTEKMLDRATTQEIGDSYTNLININSDDPAIPILEKILDEREAKGEVYKPKETEESSNEEADTIIQSAEGKQSYEKMTDADIENKMMSIEKNGGDSSEFDKLEKEMEKRERDSVFNKPLSEVSEAVNALVKKDKEQPNGYGSFIERRDARETKEVAEKYLKANELSDKELKNDFKEAILGNPDTWYADGLKLRESLKEAANRGIDTADMVNEIEKQYEKDGYSTDDAKRTIARKLSSVFKNSQKGGQNAIPIREPASPSVGEASSNSSKMGEGVSGAKEPPGTQVPEESKGAGEEEMTGITHKQMDEISEEFGFPKYEKSPETFKQWDAEAAKRLKEPGAIDSLMNKMRKEGTPSAVEQRMMLQYIASLRAKVRANPTPELLKELNRAKDVSNIVGGRFVGQSLAARKGERPTEDTLDNYLSEWSEAHGVETLPQDTIDSLAKRFNKEQELKAKVDAAYEKGRQEAADQMAVKGFEEMKKSTTRRKSNVDFKKERDDLKNSIKEKWAKAGKGKLYAAPIPFADKFEKLAAVAPDVAKLAKSYIEEGVIKLDEVINRIHSDIKDGIDASKKDIRDILAGEYTERKETKNELAEKYRNLQREAELLNKIEKERLGYEKIKSTEEKIKKTARIQELEKRVKEVQALKAKELSEEPVKDVSETTIDELSKLKKERLTQIENLREKLRNKDYSEEPPPPRRIVLDKEAQRLEDEYAKMKEEDLYQQEKAKYDRMGKATKAWDYVWKVAGLRRVIQTAIDFSIPFRQNITTTLNPLKWMPRWENGELKTPTNIRQFKNMFLQTFSPKHVNEYFKALKDTGEYYEMKQDGIVFSNPSEIELSKREEDFRNNIFQDIRKLRDRDSKTAKVISYISEPILASERAAAGALNTVRVERYRFAKKALESQGITRKNNPEAYKKMGEWIMNMTGRGKMLEMIEQSRGASRLAGNTFYGAKLMASRFNLLKNPFLSKMPKEVRVETFKDMAGFVSGVVMTGLALMAAGGKVSFNPDDSDFLQVQFGDTKYDISGGMVAYIRTFLRLTKTAYKEGHALATGSKKDKKDADKYGAFAGRTGLSFITNKFAPNTSYAYHFITGKSPGTDTGEFDPKEFLEYYPMYVDDIKDGWQRNGISSLLTIGVPGLFGVGTQTYADKPKK